MSHDAIPPVGPSASPSQVRETKKRARFSKRLQDDDVRHVLATPAGRRLVWRILEFGGIWRGGFRDSERLQFDAGQRNVALFVLAICEQAQPNTLEVIRVQHERDTMSRPKPSTPPTQESDA